MSDAEESPTEIPLFPLPNIVLFPGTGVPLYVFEPRYQQMTRDALSDHRRMGMVAVPAEHQMSMQGDPPVYSIGCEGEIAQAQEAPDGTFKLLLRATRRFRIVDERLPLGERLYRTARVETCPDQNPAADLESLATVRVEMLVLLAELMKRAVPKQAQHFGSDRFKNVDDIRLVHSLSQALDLEAKDKQQLLELDRIRDRQRMLCEFMRFRIAEFDQGGAAGPGTVH